MMRLPTVSLKPDTPTYTLEEGTHFGLHKNAAANFACSSSAESRVWSAVLPGVAVHDAP